MNQGLLATTTKTGCIHSARQDTPQSRQTGDTLTATASASALRQRIHLPQGGTTPQPTFSPPQTAFIKRTATTLTHHQQYQRQRQVTDNVHRSRSVGCPPVHLARPVLDVLFGALVLPVLGHFKSSVPAPRRCSITGRLPKHTRAVEFSRIFRGPIRRGQQARRPTAESSKHVGNGEKPFRASHDF